MCTPRRTRSGRWRPPRRRSVTTCHKVQKDGIHGMERRKKRNPPCTTCHNPHDHERRPGHDAGQPLRGLPVLPRPGTPWPTATGSAPRPRVITKSWCNPDRTCLDCHQGITHGVPRQTAQPSDAPGACGQSQGRPVLPRVCLIPPGCCIEHPGSQPFRQGANCQQCHRGEEAAMGAALADGGKQPPHHANCR